MTLMGRSTRVGIHAQHVAVRTRVIAINLVIAVLEPPPLPLAFDTLNIISLSHSRDATRENIETATRLQASYRQRMETLKPQVITETVEVTGHVIDSPTLAMILDRILASGADYRITDIDIGRTNLDQSHVVIDVSASEPKLLEDLLSELHAHGVNRTAGAGDAELVACNDDGVLPDGFYSTTNLPTEARITGRWLKVELPEMDCALAFDPASDQLRAVPMHKVKARDLVVVGERGVRVKAPERARDTTNFEFMSSDASSEKPKEMIVAHIAERMRAARAANPAGRILAVCGPAVIHTGAGPALSRLVRHGWIDVLFAGNGFAAHDIESNVLGTSLGVSIGDGAQVTGGHSNHLRVINAVRRHGSIAAAVESGYLHSGVIYETIQRGAPFVLAGSLRDDGPLPDVITDVLTAADTMRSHLSGVRVALILASTLHAIATGNLLASSVETFCVDINHAVVTKLADRGSHQALGVVTDVGLFTSALASALCDS